MTYWQKCAIAFLKGYLCAVIPVAVFAAGVSVRLAGW